jgi:hypothetical protein
MIHSFEREVEVLHVFVDTELDFYPFRCQLARDGITYV